MMKKISNILLITVVILTLLLLSYVDDPYVGKQAMYDLIDQTVYSETSDAYLFDNPSATINIVILPGGLVDASAYLYLASELYHAGHTVTVLKPPLYLAFTVLNQVDSYFNESLVNVLIGHSLGGAMASIVASNNDAVDGLVLLASYASEDVNNKAVLVILGEEDHVLDMDTYNENTHNMTNREEILIEGGNHAQFGWYGPQTNDGTASISPLTQQTITLTNIKLFLGGLSND
jgi:pimeloyl-ACP methyl ester carboxylesterase